jgi:hypothetical protein
VLFFREWSDIHFRPLRYGKSALLVRQAKLLVMINDIEIENTLGYTRIESFRITSKPQSPDSRPVFSYMIDHSSTISITLLPEGAGRHVQQLRLIEQHSRGLGQL